eukprot:CCRYP_012784-RA/>CCRYP_012784-RA protein AED:0.09 eAED:0.09 QI:0/0/0/1/1/1/2/0/532
MLISSLRTPSRHVAMAFNAASSVLLSRGPPQSRYGPCPNNNIISHMSFTQDSSSPDYNALKVGQLRELLKQRGMDVTGIKAELVERVSMGDVGGVDGDDRVDTRKIDNNGSEEIATSAHTMAVKEKANKLQDRLPPNLQFLEEVPGVEDWDEEYIDDEDDDDDDDVEEFDPNKTVAASPRNDRGKNKGKRGGSDPAQTTLNDDFQATRVFVQGLPKDATWQDLKDHFQRTGEVVFASVSVDRKTGESKQCGIVQYATPEMAAAAIRVMRNHPMNGAKLYVRQDVQETRGGKKDEQHRRSGMNEYKIRLPSEWRRANDEDDGKAGQYHIAPDELREIENLVKKRDMERRKKRYNLSDAMRDELKERHGVHLDDDLKLWWTDTNSGKVPGLISDIKGEGRWGKLKPWRQIPTTPDNDALVDADRVTSLLNKRDKARKMKDFSTADLLLQEAYDAPSGGLGLRIHDESRTWRVWTEAPPPKKIADGSGKLTPAEMCLQLVEENEPEKLHEVKSLLKKFPGREWGIFKKLKERYDS